jgi:L-ascorbate metabolism protein UlaG (beta-lactamase superfamily)
MRIVKFSHACVRVESDGAVLVIDPGGFSERAALDGVDAVLITHEHADHVNYDMLADALAGRPEVRIFTHASVLPQIGDLASVATTVESGDTFEAAGLPVSAFGGWHGLIHPDIPRVPNLGFLVADSLYHPGDSFDPPVLPEGLELDTLFVPVSAPWLKLSEAVEFVRAVRPRRAYALHDCLLSDIGHNLATALMQRLALPDYARLQPGEAVTTKA